MRRAGFSLCLSLSIFLLVSHASTALANLSCTADVQIKIADKTLPFDPTAPVFQVKDQPTQLERHMAMYHTVTVHDGTVFYNALITREDPIIGRTVCSCVEFRNSKTGYSLFGFSGSWGINPGKHSKRSVSEKYLMEFPDLIKAADQIYIVAGRCPTDRAFKGTVYIASRVAEAGVRAFLISKGVPPEVVEEISTSK